MKVICAEELFFLGKLMSARYIDYDYVKAMKDIQKNGALKEKEIMAGLVKKGILYEDFSGEKELDPEMEELLTPLFFGEFESELIYYQAEDSKKAKQHKFHFHKGKITHVQIKKGKLEVSDGDDVMENLQNHLIPEGYKCESKEVQMEELDKNQITIVMILKNMNIGKKSVCSQFVNLNDIWYVGKKDNLAESLEKEAMVKRWNEIMKGANE